jgi:acetylornithine deacetylase/succinyl-diaminopimelate desuccinylase-like protein
MLVRLQLDIAEGRRSRRDLIVAYFADEEMGGVLGSQWITTHRPDLFLGAEEALGEIGGFNIELPTGGRAFLIQTAEHGMLWMRITVRSAAELVSAISALQVDESPLEATRALESGLAALLGDGVAQAESVTPLVGLGRHTRFNPTVIAAGVKPNVIPDRVELIVDCRFLPGGRERALDAIASVLPEGVELEIMAQADGLESPVDAPIVDALRATVQQAFPGSSVLPFVMPGGSDSQKFAAMGIRGYGFTPLVLPPDYSYVEMFHAVNERVPLDAIDAGYQLLSDFALKY